MGNELHSARYRAEELEDAQDIQMFQNIPSLLQFTIFTLVLGSGFFKVLMKTNICYYRFSEKFESMAV